MAPTCTVVHEVGEFYVLEAVTLSIADDVLEVWIYSLDGATAVGRESLQVHKTNIEQLHESDR